MQNLALARNLLFTPADRPERFGKAISVGADGAVLDLEDGTWKRASAASRAFCLAGSPMMHLI